MEYVIWLLDLIHARFMIVDIWLGVVVFYVKRQCFINHQSSPRTLTIPLSIFQFTLPFVCLFSSGYGPLKIYVDRLNARNSLSDTGSVSGIHTISAIEFTRSALVPRVSVSVSRIQVCRARDHRQVLELTPLQTTEVDSEVELNDKHGEPSIRPGTCVWQGRTGMLGVALA
jgi:hypothetical protein